MIEVDVREAYAACGTEAGSKEYGILRNANSDWEMYLVVSKEDMAEDAGACAASEVAFAHQAFPV